MSIIRRNNKIILSNIGGNLYSIDKKPSKKSFKITINTSLGDGNPTFTLPLRQSADTGNFNYDFIVDWGDGTSNKVTSWDDSGITHTYNDNDRYQVKINGICQAWSFDNGGDKDKLISIDRWGETGFIDMGWAFRGCSNLVSCEDDDGDWCKNVTKMNWMFGTCHNIKHINVSNWDVSKVTNMFVMFWCQSLETLDVSNWNTSAVTNMSYMFYNCYNLQALDVSNWNTSAVTLMNDMFSSCYNLQALDVSTCNTSSVTNMSYMFYKCYPLTALDVSNWNTSAVTNMSYMFRESINLMSLDVSNWNTSAVTNMRWMFGATAAAPNMKLTNVGDLSNWNTSAVTNMDAMFQKCTGLTSVGDLTNWDTSNVTTMRAVFSECHSLTGLSVTNWNTVNVTNMQYLFERCYGITSIDVSNWNVTGVTDFSNMFTDVPLDTASYDALLNGWSSLPSLVASRTLTANLAQYSCLGKDAHDYITTAYTWTFNDAGLNVDSCNPFKITIDTSLGDGLAEMQLPLRNGFNYNFVVNWGDGNLDTITTYNQAETNHTYSSGGVYQISISGTCEAWYFNNAGDKDKLISIDRWGETGFIDMNGAFRGCSNLTGATDTYGDWCKNVTDMFTMFHTCTSLSVIDTSNWNIGAVTILRSTFNTCSSLTTLDVSNWDIGAVIDASNAFKDCSSLTTLDVSNWNTSSISNAGFMFQGCSSLTTLDVSNWNTSAVTSMWGMFRNCRVLHSIDVSNWDVGNVTNMDSTFLDCLSLISIDISNWDVSKVTNMRTMFYFCSSLTALDVSEWNTSAVTDMSSMFQGCSSLTTLYVNNWNTSAVTKISAMFYNCSSLTDINSLSGWNTSAVTHMDRMFNGCSSLTDINSLSGWNTSAVTQMDRMFNGCSSLTDISPIANWDVQNVATYTLFNSMYEMFIGATGVTTTSYDAVLNAWSQLPNLNSGVRLDMSTSTKYSSAAQAARNILTSAPNNWIINDGGLAL